MKCNVIKFKMTQIKLKRIREPVLGQMLPCAYIKGTPTSRPAWKHTW